MPDLRRLLRLCRLRESFDPKHVKNKEACTSRMIEMYMLFLLDWINVLHKSEETNNPSKNYHLINDDRIHG